MVLLRLEMYSRTSPLPIHIIDLSPTQVWKEICPEYLEVSTFEARNLVSLVL